MSEPVESEGRAFRGRRKSFFAMPEPTAPPMTLHPHRVESGKASASKRHSFAPIAISFFSIRMSACAKGFQPA
jgi:hypothetical protein